MTRRVGEDVRETGVAEVVAERLRGAATRDGVKVALVIEGGGMRGIVSAAMACALEECGVLSVVDLVVGTSSGAVNAAAAVRGTISGFADSYADVFSSREFIDVRRMVGRTPVVDSARIVAHIDDLFGIGDPVGSSAPQLVVVATDVGAARAEALTDFLDRSDQLASIHASGLLPVFGGAPIALRGRRWLDGGIVQPVPVTAAANLGATHAIVLATRPLGAAPTFGTSDRLVQRYLRRVNPALGEVYGQRPDRYRAVLRESSQGLSAGVRTLVFAPDDGAVLPGRLDRSVERLRSTQNASRERALRMLSELGLAV